MGDQELQIFQTLADRVCVFDFLMARGFKGADWMELFRQRLRVVRESLEEDRSAAWWHYEFRFKRDIVESFM